VLSIIYGMEVKSVNGEARNTNEARWHIGLRECGTMGVDRSMVLRTLKSIILALYGLGMQAG
jgi:hypothetical protein